MTSPFHAGEQAIQRRVGVRDEIEALGQRIIRPFMPEQHRQFFGQLPWLLVGSQSADGQPDASLLWGEAGFVQAPTAERLRIDATPEADDPLAANLQPDARLGLLGIELPTRRRNRMNGAVLERDTQGFSVGVQQSFGNCPRYIQARHWQYEVRQPGPLEQGEGLDERWLSLVRGSDTVFIASQNGDPHSGGVDVSHRGGPSGFVSLGDDQRLWMPDYNGNQLFNTLGNLLLEPHCGLLWIDFESGDLLQLQARAELLWPEQAAAAHIPLPAGAERLVAFTPERWRLRRARLPLRFGSPQPSPHLP